MNHLLPLWILVAGLGGAIVLGYLLSRKVPPIVFFLLGLAPVIVVYLLNPNHRIYSFHGFLHAGTVYQILENGLPPSNPLFAGEPLLYPWGFHTVVAGCVALFHVSPPWAFAAVNLISLALLLYLTYQIAAALTEDRTARLLAVILTLFAFSFFPSKPFAGLLQVMDVEIATDQAKRISPLLNKFTNANGVPLGLLCFALWLRSLIAVHTVDGARVRATIFLFLGTFGCGFAYPLLFLPLTASAALIVAIMALGRDRRMRAATMRAAATMAAAGLLLLPFFYLFAAAKEGTASLHLSFEPARVARQGGQFLLAVLPLAAVAVVYRQALLPLIRRRSPALTILAATALASAALYLFLVIPTGASYKPMIAFVYAAGIAGALPFAELLRRRGTVATLLLAALLMPLAEITLIRLKRGRNWPIICSENGRDLVHTDSDLKRFYHWIRTATPPQAVFVDSVLHLPVFARRQLFIGMDSGKPKLGYTLRIRDYLRLSNGYDQAAVRRRRTVVKRLFADRPQIGHGLLDEVAATVPGREIYFISRSAMQRQKFEAEPRLLRVFETGGVAAFRLTEGAVPRSAGPVAPPTHLDSAGESPRP